MISTETDPQRDVIAPPEAARSFRPRSFAAPPPDPAEALYYEGMAAYQHRNWDGALERFGRLKELQPNRPGLDALLDEVRWFLQLQSTAPGAGGRAVPQSAGLPAGEAPRREPAQPPRPKWQTGALIALALIGVLALVLIASDARLPWINAADRGTQELYNRGQARLAVGDYEGAQAAFSEVLKIKPNDPEASQGLSRAERQQTLAQGYAAAETALAEDDWETAAAELAKVLAVDPTYRDAQKKADFVAQRRRLAAIYADGGRLYDLGRWEEAIAQFAKIQELDSTYRREEVNAFLFVCYLNAGQGLIDTADAKVAPVQRAIEYFSSALAIQPRNRPAADARRLGSLYLDAARGLASGNSAEAQARLEALLTEAPTYANGQAAKQLYALLLKRAEVAVQTGDIPSAVRFYQSAQGSLVPDHTAAIQGEATARAITPTPTPRPTSPPRPTAPSSTPTPYAVARTDGLNVRSGPGTAYPVIGQMPSTAEGLAVISRNADGTWLQVCCVAPDEPGWVAASLVDLQGVVELLAVVTPPPLPTASAIAEPRPTAAAGQFICLAGRVRDTAGGALTGWTVSLQGMQGFSQTQRTSADGAYRFDNLTATPYTIGVTLEPGWRAVSPQSTAVTLVAANACMVVDFWNERTDGRPGPAPTSVPAPTDTPKPPPSPTPPR